MTAAIVGVLVAVWLGAVVAVSARDPRVTGIGVAVALVAASFLHDPLPAPALLATQLIGGLLAATLVRTAGPGPAEPQAGWPSEALLGLAGAFAGLGLVTGLATAAAGIGGPSVPAGPAAAGSGLLLVLALPAAASGRPGPRHAAAVILLVQAVLLFRTAIAGPASALEVVAFSALLITTGATAALLSRMADRARASEGAPAQLQPELPAGRRA